MKRFLLLSFLTLALGMSHARSHSKNGHDYVDLGLPSGTLWATCNIGADKPEDSGDYFQWGNTEPYVPDSIMVEGKMLYADKRVRQLAEKYPEAERREVMSANKMMTDKHCTKDKDKWVYSKYYADMPKGIVDNHMELDLEDDAAYAVWGADWCTPSMEDYLELRLYTTHKDTILNGTAGYLLTSNISGFKDRSVFFPAAGSFDGYCTEKDLRRNKRGLYWSRSVGRDTYGATTVLNFNYWPFALPGKFGSGLISSSYHIRTSYGSVRSVLRKKRSDYEAERMERIFETNRYDTCGIKNGHEYVDLGLPSGTLWATCNIGADKPENDGNYFLWGETKPCVIDGRSKTSSIYKHAAGVKDSLTKYCTNARYGKVDLKTELELEDDAAYTNWGSNWRVPSEEQIKELLDYDNTDQLLTTRNGVFGCLFTSKRSGYVGKSIFLPAAGSVDGILTLHKGMYTSNKYWTRTLAYYKAGSTHAFCLFFSSNGRAGILNGERLNANVIRPVWRQVKH